MPRFAAHQGANVSLLIWRRTSGEFLKIIFFPEIFAEYSPEICLFCQIGIWGKFSILNLGNLIKSICCLFCMNDAEEVDRFYGSFRALVKAGECVWIINSFHPAAAETRLSWRHLQYKPGLMLGYLPYDQSEGLALSSFECSQVYGG